MSFVPGFLAYIIFVLIDTVVAVAACFEQNLKLHLSAKVILGDVDIKSEVQKFHFDDTVFSKFNGELRDKTHEVGLRWAYDIYYAYADGRYGFFHVSYWRYDVLCS